MRKLRKNFAILLCAFLSALSLFSFAGCGETGDTGPGLGTEEPPKEELPKEELPKEEEPADVGEMKSLKEAYEAGWISHDDLKNIAYYYNGENDAPYHEVLEFHDENDEVVEYVPCPEAEFIPTPMSYKNFTHATIKKMKYSYRNYISSQAELDKIGVIGYYGEYNNCLAVTMYEAIETDGMCGDPPETFIRDVYQLEDMYFYGNSAKELIIWNPTINQ